MNPLRKKIVIGYFICLAVVALIVPWKVDYPNGEGYLTLNRGYALLFSQPHNLATIDYGKITLEIIIISAIAGSLVIFYDRH